MTLVNKRADANEKMGHIFTVCGKKTTEVPVIGCGDIGAVSSWLPPKTGDTLSMSVRKGWSGADRDCAAVLHAGNRA